MVTFLTEVTSATAATTLLMPVLAAAGLAAGLDPRLLMVPAAISASCAFMLPVATAPNAIIYGSGGILDPGWPAPIAMNLIGAVAVAEHLHRPAGLRGGASGRGAGGAGAVQAREEALAHPEVQEAPLHGDGDRFVAVLEVRREAGLDDGLAGLAREHPVLGQVEGGVAAEDVRWIRALVPCEAGAHGDVRRPGDVGVGEPHMSMVGSSA